MVEIGLPHIGETPHCFPAVQWRLEPARISPAENDRDADDAHGQQGRCDHYGHTRRQHYDEDRSTERKERQLEAVVWKIHPQVSLGVG
jgi:hypothetical protein